MTHSLLNYKEFNNTLNFFDNEYDINVLQDLQDYDGDFTFAGSFVPKNNEFIPYKFDILINETGGMNNLDVMFDTFNFFDNEYDINVLQELQDYDGDFIFAGSFVPKTNEFIPSNFDILINESTIKKPGDSDSDIAVFQTLKGQPLFVTKSSDTQLLYRIIAENGISDTTSIMPKLFGNYRIIVLTSNQLNRIQRYEIDYIFYEGFDRNRGSLYINLLSRKN